MAKNPLIINPVDEGKLSLEFSKENLSEFVFSLLATPRQEKREHVGGFDLSLDEAKIIFDKVIHKISTDHDILHNEFLSQITFDNGTVVTYNSYDQLFSTTEIRDDPVKEFTVTISVVIPFNRPDDEKSFEKQILVLSFKSGKIGKVTTEIRSTEITWPEGYFNLIIQHLKKLSQSVDNHSNSILDKIFFFYPLFLSDSDDDDRKINSEQTRLFVLMVTMLVMMTMMASLWSSFTSQFFSDSIVILNEDSGLLEKFNTQEIVEEKGLEEVADAVSQTNAVKGAYEYAAGSEPTSFFSHLFSGFKNSFSLIAFISVFALAFANFLYARVKSSARYGRILIFYNRVPERPKNGVLSGTFASVFIGALGSAMATMIMNVF